MNNQNSCATFRVGSILIGMNPNQAQTPGTKESDDSFMRFIFIVMLIALPIRIFIFWPFVVSGESMVPTFQDKQYLIIDKLHFKLHDIERGDVVIFKYPKDPSRYFIKRIIGLPNETVLVKNGVVTISDQSKQHIITLNEPYISETTNGSSEITLADDEYFVMGDNRPQSSDSRVWGPVQKDLIVGRAAARLFPLSSADILPGEYHYLLDSKETAK